VELLGVTAVVYVKNSEAAGRATRFTTSTNSKPESDTRRGGSSDKHSSNTASGLHRLRSDTQGSGKMSLHQAALRRDPQLSRDGRVQLGQQATPPLPEKRFAWWGGLRAGRKDAEHVRRREGASVHLSQLRDDGPSPSEGPEETFQQTNPGVELGPMRMGSCQHHLESRGLVGQQLKAASTSSGGLVRASPDSEREGGMLTVAEEGGQDVAVDQASWDAL